MILRKLLENLVDLELEDKITKTLNRFKFFYYFTWKNLKLDYILILSIIELKKLILF